MTFANNWTISVQFGYCNYCVNKNHPAGMDLERQDSVESSNAEIAIWDKDGNWYTFDNGDVVEGYCDTNTIADWISKVSKFD